MKNKKSLKLKAPERSDVFLWLGALILCAGVGRINISAGIITFGLFLIFIAVSEIKPSKGG